MYALFTELNVPDGASHDDARKALTDNAIPMVKSQGASTGFWLTEHDGRSVAMVVFPDEASAKQMASMLSVGQAPPGAPDGVTFGTVEVREVLASF